MVSDALCSTRSRLGDRKEREKTPDFESGKANHTGTLTLTERKGEPYPDLLLPPVCCRRAGKKDCRRRVKSSLDRAYGSPALLTVDTVVRPLDGGALNHEGERAHWQGPCGDTASSFRPPWMATTASWMRRWRENEVKKMKVRVRGISRRTFLFPRKQRRAVGSQ
jgi:hypothetical protein